MTRHRLRGLPDLAATYRRPHDHRRYGRGHRERVDATIKLVRSLGHVGMVADLSCGNAAIALAADADTHYLGDYAPGYRYTGRLEDTIGGIDKVDLYLCCETLEHLADPDMVLLAIRAKCRSLVLSTPIENWDDTNAEHLWAWDQDGVEAMLAAARFRVVRYEAVDTRVYGEPYCYGIWLAV